MGKIISLGLLLLGPGLSFAQTPQDRGTIRVTASATVARAAEQALLLVQAESFATSKDSAGEQSEAQLALAIDALRGAGIPLLGTRTSSPAVEPSSVPAAERRASSTRFSVSELLWIFVPGDSVELAAAVVELAHSLGIHDPRLRANEDRRQVALLAYAYGETASEAAENYEALLDKIMSGLAELGTDAFEIQRRDYTLMTSESEGGGAAQERLSGFVARSCAYVVIDSAELVSTAIDVALNAGAARAVPVAYGLRDPDAAYVRAAERATEKAMQQAEAVADAAGARLGRLERISTEAAEGALGIDLEAAVSALPTARAESALLRAAATVVIDYRLER